MPLSDETEFLITAQKAARLAGEVILNNLGSVSKEDVNVKQASDFVTRIDKDSEQIIIKTIKERFPDHQFLAEESVKEIAGEYRWIIDPLDGTTNYIHGYPAFAVSIALEYSPCTPAAFLRKQEAWVQDKGGIILGVIFDPLRNELFAAEKGRGAFLNRAPVKVSPATQSKDSLITTGFPFRKKQMIDPYLQLFKNIFNKVSDIRRAGSAALDLAHLACGRCDGFFEIGLSPWDIAAGSLLIEEAGGVVTDFEGGKDYLLTGNIVAGTPALHKEILKEVKDVFKGIIDK